MTSRGFIERRGRLSLAIWVTVKVDDRSYTARACNIGRGGIFVATDRPLGVGRLAILRFALPNFDVPRSVLAEARWFRERAEGEGLVVGTGFRFVGPAIGIITCIDDLVRNHDEDLTPSDHPQAAGRDGSTGLIGPAVGRRP